MPASAVRLVAVALWASSIACSTAPDWESVRERIRRDYPQVRHVTAEELAAELESTDGDALLLLDARTQREYAVSHLRGARPVPTPGALEDVLRDVAPTQRIVVYCSVGLRSAKLAARLQARGFRDVANLEGSIFAWANAGRPVFRGTERVGVVHPYDRRWGKLLDRRLWYER